MRRPSISVARAESDAIPYPSRPAPRVAGKPSVDLGTSGAAMFAASAAEASARMRSVARPSRARHAQGRRLRRTNPSLGAVPRGRRCLNRASRRVTKDLVPREREARISFAVLQAGQCEMFYNKPDRCLTALSSRSCRIHHAPVLPFRVPASLCGCPLQRLAFAPAYCVLWVRSCGDGYRGSVTADLGFRTCRWATTAIRPFSSRVRSRAAAGAILSAHAPGSRPCSRASRCDADRRRLDVTSDTLPPPKNPKHRLSAAYRRIDRRSDHVYDMVAMALSAPACSRLRRRARAFCSTPSRRGVARFPRIGRSPRCRASCSAPFARLRQTLA